MALTISLRGKKDDDHVLYPEAENLPAMHAHGQVHDEFWSSSHEEGQLAVDVYETEKDIVLQSAIAGVRLDDLEVFLHNDMLTVRGKRTLERDEDASPLVNECHWGRFSRSVILPTDIDADNIKASLKEGVLTVRMPKIERSKHITVKRS